MTNIFQAFRDYERTLSRKPFSWEIDDPGPLFEETAEQRKAAMARLRASYPDLFDRTPAPEADNPINQLEALAEASRATPIAPSEALIAKYRFTENGPTKPEEPTP